MFLRHFRSHIVDAKYCSDHLVNNMVVVVRFYISLLGKSNRDFYSE